MAESKQLQAAGNKRSGPRDRRKALEDRREPERVQDDYSPRRNPEQTDRRQR